MTTTINVSAAAAYEVRAAARARRGPSLRRRLRRHGTGYLFMLGAVVCFALFSWYPMIREVIMSFQKTNFAGQTAWVGLENYRHIFADPEFWAALRNTVLFAAVVVPLTLLVGTGIGLLLNSLGRKMSTFVAGAALLAWATPPTAGAVLFYWLFNPDGGLVDWTLSKMPHWLVGSTDWAQYNWTTTGALQAYTVLTLLVLWTSFPFVAVTVLAGLKTVPAELYEAAWIDGATPWRAFWRVTYPLLRPIFRVLFMLSVIWDFGVFTQVFIIIGELGQRDEYNLGIYEYATAFQLPPAYGLASALAFILTIILLIITAGYVRASVRGGALR